MGRTIRFRPLSWKKTFVVFSNSWHLPAHPRRNFKRKLVKPGYTYRCKCKKTPVKKFTIGGKPPKNVAGVAGFSQGIIPHHHPLKCEGHSPNRPRRSKIPPHKALRRAWQVWHRAREIETPAMGISGMPLPQEIRPEMKR